MIACHAMGSGPSIAVLSARLSKLHRDDGRRPPPRRVAQETPPDRPAVIEYGVRNGVLSIELSGPLDLRCAFRLLAIAGALDDAVIACRLSLLGVTQVYDSGLAVLLLLIKVLAEKGVSWVRIDDPRTER